MPSHLGRREGKLAWGRKVGMATSPRETQNHKTQTQTQHNRGPKVSGAKVEKGRGGGQGSRLKDALETGGGGGGGIEERHPSPPILVNPPCMWGPSCAGSRGKPEQRLVRTSQRGEKWDWLGGERMEISTGVLEFDEVWVGAKRRPKASDPGTEIEEPRFFNR